MGGGSQEGATDLLIEAGSYGVTLVWHKKSANEWMAVQSYQYRGLNIDGHASQLKGILDNLSLHGKEVQLVFNNKESMLVPTEYQDEKSDSALINLFFGNADGETYKGKVFGDDDKLVIYRVCAPVDQLLKSYFPLCTPVHATQFQASHSQEGITCNVYHNHLKVTLIQEGVLKLIQYFDYQTPTDAAYHLLNMCDLHDVDRELVEVHLSGMIEQDSNLYREFAKYFLNISLVAPSFTLPNTISQSEHHYFSHFSAYML